MIIYLCMKNESNTSLFSKDIAWKPFFIRKSRAITHIITGGLSVIDLDLYFMIIYLCMKYESNTPLYSKDIAENHFLYIWDGTYVRTDVRTDKGDAMCPHYKWRGHKNISILHLSCRTSDLQFSLVLQTHALVL